MSRYSLVAQDQAYELSDSGCSFYLNDEDQPLKGFDLKTVFELLNQTDQAYFEPVYYDQRCEACGKNKQPESKYYQFLECHFYLFSLNQSYVMSSLSSEYDHKTLSELFKTGVVNGTYLISINVCPRCGDYTVELEYGEF